MSFSYHTFILKNDGTLWGCGYNEYGQLGLEDTTHRKTFTQITTNANDIKSVCCNYWYSTILLKNDDTIWGCGYNIDGELGLGDISSSTTFTQIIDVYDVKSIYCGISNTFILKNDGTLWGCGANTYSQLGLGDKNGRKTFTQIATNTDDIKSVYCGTNHTFILENNGTLWGCGRNDYGQLGLGTDTNNKTIFTQITSNVYDIKSIYCGSDHTFILKNDGTLWGCGYNNYGQLGLGDANHRTTFTQIIDIDDIKSIYCGGYHTFVLKNDGTLLGCGWNNHGQLGLTNVTTRTTFTKITEDVKSVYCGNYHTFVLKNDGTLWGCGYNADGELGLGDTVSRNTLTQITTNVDNIKKFADNYSIAPSVIKIYDTKVGYVETLDTNNFRNISVNSVERLKSLCTNPDNTYLNCLISFDKKQTWKTFDGTDWTIISNISPENIILNGMQLKTLDKLDKNQLISGGFTGDLDFKIAMKTNNKTVTSSVTKIYIEYK